MYAKNLFIALYDETTGLLSFPYFVDEMDEPFKTQPLEEFPGLTSYVIRTGNSIKHGWGQFTDLIEKHEAELVGTFNEDGIGAPLRVDEKIIGAIFVQSYTKGISYTEQDDEILATIAQYIASALLRFRALDAERQRNTELAIINFVQSGLAAEIEFQAIIDLVGNKLKEAFSTGNLIVTIYDSETQLLHYLFAYEHGEKLSIPPHPPHEKGVVRKILDTHCTTYLEYGGKNDEDTRAYPGTDVCKSGIAVPIVSSDQILGVIQIENFEREAVYAESELRLLLTIAASLGTALEKAQLTDQKNAAVEALRESEEKFRKIVNTLPQYISIWDLNMKCTYVSPAVYRLTGYTPEERLALKIQEHITPGTLKVLTETLNYSLTQERDAERDPQLVVIRELEEIRKDGSKVIFETTFTFLRDIKGEPSAILAIAADITERKKTEAQRDEAIAALRQSEERYRLIAENSDDVIWTTDNDYRLTYVSPSIRKLRGVEPEEALRESLEEIMPCGSLEALLGAYESVRSDIDQGKDETIRLEVQQFCKDGSTIWVEISRQAMRNSEGKLTGFVGVSRDITKRKETEAIARESERRMADIINFLPIATMVIDEQGRVTAWNKAMEEMTGVKREDILGKGDYEYAIPFYGQRRPILIDLVSVPEEELSINYQHIIRNGGILSAEAIIHREEGKVILTGFASPLFGADGQLQGAIESVRDITDLRHAEARLSEAKEAAEAANQSKSAFLANMSHEIRTPMNAILGFVQLMKREPQLSHRQLEHLEIINRSGEHLLALINDILEISKIEAGRSIFIPGVFDFLRLMDDIEMMFRIRTEEKNLWFMVEKMGDIPRWIVTDEGKLRQILINLIGNAVKFTSEGGIGVRIGMQNAEAKKFELHFEIEDTGPGMAEDEIGRLFQVFEQTTSGQKMGGTGLGLALSRGFVHILGGTINVTSIPGKGSIFRFWIPVEESAEILTEQKTTARRVIKLKPDQGEVRVLVADDRETNRQFLVQMLSMAGFTTMEVTNGAEAVEAFHQWQPRIILLDMAMPIMDGYEAMSIIRGTEDGKMAAIIAITASAFQEDRKKVLENGADGFLSKPFKEADLFEAIREHSGIAYIYEDELSLLEKDETDGSTPRWRHELISLPKEWVRACQEAADNADIFKLMALMENNPQINPVILQKLNDMVSRYAYEEIIQLLSAGG